MFLVTSDGKIQIQVRFSQAVGAGFGTVMSALLFKVEGVVPIQISHNSNGSWNVMHVFINIVYCINLREISIQCYAFL